MRRDLPTRLYDRDAGIAGDRANYSTSARNRYLTVMTDINIGMSVPSGSNTKIARYV